MSGSGGSGSQGVTLSDQQFQQLLAQVGQHGTRPGKLPDLNAKFSGDTTEFKYADNFLDRIESYFDVHQIADIKERLEKLQREAFPFKSVAYSWFSRAKTAGQFPTWDDFRKLFKERFGIRAGDVSQLFEKTSSAKQKPKQTASDFLNYLQNTWDSLECAGVPLSDPIKFHQFKAGVHAPIRAHIDAEQAKLDTGACLSLSRAAAIATAFDNSAHTRANVDLNAFSSGFKRQGGGNKQGGSGGSKPGGNPPGRKKWCFLHKTTSHDASECRVIARKKAEGTWEDKKKDGDQGPSTSSNR